MVLTPTESKDSSMTAQCNRLLGALSLTFLVVAVILRPLPLHAQGTPNQAPLIKKNQFGIDVGGPLNWSFSYVRRTSARALSIGGSVGFGWELNLHTLDRNIWDALYVQAIGRYQPTPVLQFDAGPTLLNYYWADDCGECHGMFFGLQVRAGIGNPTFSLGMTTLLGLADDDRNGVTLGAIWLPNLRIVIPWGN